MKPPLRTKSVGTKVSEAEFALLEERARGAGMRLGEWVREALLSAPAESGRVAHPSISGAPSMTCFIVMGGVASVRGYSRTIGFKSPLLLPLR